MTAPQRIPDVRRGRNRLAAIVVLGHGVKHVYNSGLQSLLLPEIKIGLGLSGAQFGSLLTARQVTSWGTTLVGGYLGDRFTNKAPAILGLSLGMIGVSFYLAGSVTSYWAMLAAMLFIGLGPSLYHPPALGELSRRFPERRGFAVSLHGTGGIAGEVVGPLIVAGLLVLMSWQGVMQWSIVPAMVTGLLIWGLMRPLPEKQAGAASSREYFLSLATLLRNRTILLLVLVTAMRSAADTAVAGFLPVYLRQDLEFSELRVAAYLSLAQVAGLGAQPAMGVISDRLGRMAVMVPGLAALSVLSFALAFADTGLWLAIIVVAMGAFRFSIHHIFIAAAIDAAQGRMQSTAVALIYGAGVLGTFSPYLAGLLVDEYGTQSAFLYGGSLALLGTLVLAARR